MEQRRTEQMRQAKELEEQHAAEIARQLEELKAANKALKETNEELVSKCNGLD